MKSSRKVWEQGLTVIPTINSSVPTSLYMSVQARRLSLDFIAFWRPFVSTAQKSRQLHTLVLGALSGPPEQVHMFCPALSCETNRQTASHCAPNLEASKDVFARTAMYATHSGQGECPEFQVQDLGM